MHSHNYRTPEELYGKSVLVIGGGPSGIDISWDMSKYATKVKECLIYFYTHFEQPFKEQIFLWIIILISWLGIS